MSGFSAIIGANLALDAVFGDDAGADAPASFTLRAYTGDPDSTGVELDATNYPGYAAASLTNNSTNFPNAVDGVKTCPAVGIGTATGDWVDSAKYWALCSLATTDRVYTARISTTDIPVNTDVVTVVPVLFPRTG